MAKVIPPLNNHVRRIVNGDHGKRLPPYFAARSTGLMTYNARTEKGAED